MCTEKKLIMTAHLDEIIRVFWSKCKQYPIYECRSCRRFLLRKSVIQKKNLKLRQEIQQYFPEGTDIFLCTTCNNYLRKDSIPPQAYFNKLLLDSLPTFMNELNTLERHMVSPVLAFNKIVILPKNGQKAIHGPVVCVESEMKKVIKYKLTKRNKRWDFD